MDIYDVVEELFTTSTPHFKAMIVSMWMIYKLLLLTSRIILIVGAFVFLGIDMWKEIILVSGLLWISSEILIFVNTEIIKRIYAKALRRWDTTRYGKGKLSGGAKCNEA